MKPRHRLVSVVLVLAACAVLLLARGQAGEPLTDPARPPEKRFAFSMEAKPWNQVFKWLSDTTGQPVVAASMPAGTFSFISPKDRTYSIGELVDVLNVGLLGSHFVLIRRPDSWLLVPTDQRLDPSLIQQVRLDELPVRGRSEMVRIVVPLEGAETKDALAAVKSMLGPLGNVLPLGNRLLIADSAGNLQQITCVLHEAEVLKPSAPGGLRVITLDRGSAGTLAEELSKVLQQMRKNPVEVIVPGKQETKPPVKEPLPLPPKGETGKAVPPVRLIATGSRLMVASDDPQALELVQQLVKLYTDPMSGELKVVRLKHGSAASMAQVLDQVFNDRAGQVKVERVRVVADPGSNTLLVKATPLDLVMIEKLIAQTLDVDPGREEPAHRLYMIPLRHIQADDVARVVRDLYGIKTVAVEARTNSLMVRCTEAVFQDVRKMVELLDVRPEKKGG